MIEFEGVRKQYRQRCGWRSRPLLAVDGVSLRAGDGAITALLGPNGAGKTTCLRMLCGLTLPDAGRVLVDGIDAAGDAIAARRRVGLLSDARGLYPRMTARENIVYFGALHGMSREAAEVRCEALARPLELGPDLTGTLIARLDVCFRRRRNVARLVVRPRIVRMSGRRGNSLAGSG